MFKFPRVATWLMPGLSFKRWLGIAFSGFTLGFLGILLALNFQPVTFLISLLRELAKLFPAHISGPLLLVVGLVLFYVGTRRAYTTVKLALRSDGGGDSDLLEALYRQNKLIHGPH